jgi:hypothetical protein
VSVFSVPELSSLQGQLSILAFDCPDGTWLDYVHANRMDGYRGDVPDIVFGPVANDTIFRTFIAYGAGIYTKAETIEKLKVHELFNALHSTSPDYIVGDVMAYIDRRSAAHPS